MKLNSNHSLKRYKARVVTRGYLQVARLDYKETFSSVVKVLKIRVVLSIVVTRGWVIRYVNINNAFLNRDLTEEVFMDPPLDYEAALGMCVSLRKLFMV